MKLLEESKHVVLAVDEVSKQVVGFITAISDGVLSAYIPFLEVLPTYKGQGVGQELVKKLLDLLKDIYMIDLMCNEELQGYYQKMNLTPAHGMIRRNYDRQSGI